MMELTFLSEGLQLWQSLLVVLLGLLAYAVLTRPHRLPPGPYGVPLLGAGYQLTGNLVKDIARMRKLYGDVISLYNGSKLYVYLNSYKVIKEALITQGEEFAHRQRSTFLEIYDLKDDIFSADYCEKWKRDKRYFVSTLKRFGFGTGKAEENIQNEVDNLMEVIKKDGAPDKGGMSIHTPVICAVANVICTVLFSKSYEADDPEFLELLHINRTLFDIDQRDNFILDLLPNFITKLVFSKVRNKYKAKAQKMKDFHIRHIKEHIASHVPGEPRDFMDAYIEEKGVDNLDLEIFAGNVNAFMQDAIDSLSDIIFFAVLYVAHNPEVQSRIHQEIDTTVGRSRKPCLADRPSLPYFEATITEVIRIVTPLAILPPRSVNKDETLMGFTIPKDAYVYANVYAVHHDPGLFPEPEVFKPERFLDENEQLIKEDHTMTFGLGPRKCIGEPLVKIEVFLFLASLFQKFHISFPANEPLPSLEADFVWITHKPKPYKIVAEER